ncbi:D-alanine-D-alanine ligase [Candidatus Caldarchaeum subterraneum]|uniref:D-alanine-D-alanine ligase n=1 Tax=Caldiarchaeum subterraneum TaxID=311458 RepID=E6N6V6_CALS0|nr:D-alanine-D-alanine ligase [Candidatus Caldarchaeum subterraneum]BAJ50825.1 D-alanine-D-alanine ligase [Candidatus Caldarchaeum subterraneum]
MGDVSRLSVGDKWKGHLEQRLDPEWWTKLFGRIYLLTDSDVVLNEQLTNYEVDLMIQLLGFEKDDSILDLCCGNGRHSLELARRGFRNVTGLDYSEELLKIAREKAEAEHLKVRFARGDARSLPFQANSFDAVVMMGNSFGYFHNPLDDLIVLKQVHRILRPYGKFMIDIADGEYLRHNYQPVSTESKTDGTLIIRERELSRDRGRLVTRELVIGRDGSVVADNLYAVRLYGFEDIKALLERAGFTGVLLRTRLSYEPESNDPGMMRIRMIITAYAQKEEITNHQTRGEKVVVVLLGDPRLPNPVKPNKIFDEDDAYAVYELKNALHGIREYKFIFVDDHSKMIEFLTKNRAGIHMVFNLCDDGFKNNPEMEAHVPALLEMLGVRYTGAGPRCLTLCYDKAKVKAIASSMGIPVPHHTILFNGDNGSLKHVKYPVIVKPNYGDNSWGITERNVVRNRDELISAIKEIRVKWGYSGPILVEEFVEGMDLTVSILGNPPQDVVLPILTEDYSKLPDGLPKILTYAAKWCPDSPYRFVNSIPVELPHRLREQLIWWCRKLFAMLECRDYARFDWRLGSDGVPRLLEVNPNPGWVWDGHFAKACLVLGWSYRRMLHEILRAAEKRYAAAAHVSQELPAHAIAYP